MADPRAPLPKGLLDAELSALAGEDLADPQQLVSRVAWLAGPHTVVRILEAVREDADLLTTCAANSLAHPLGFDKLVLLSLSSLQIQLHIWWPEVPITREHIHDHRFGFCSSVLLGALQMYDYDLGEPGTVMNRFEERHEAGDADFRLRPAGSAEVRCRGVTELGPGSTYFRPADALHRVNVECAGITGTLLRSCGRCVGPRRSWSTWPPACPRWRPASRSPRRRSKTG